MILLILSLLVFSTHFFYVGDGVWGDSRYYYSYVRSLIIDHDLNFTNEYQHFKAFETNYFQGKIINKFSIGAPLLWLPWFLIADFIVNIVNIIGFNLNIDGYGIIYQFIIGIGTVIYGFWGLYLLFKSLETFFNKNLSIWGIIIFFLSSNLFFYLAIDPINSHSTSFFISSLLFYFLIKLQKIDVFDLKYTFKTPVVLGIIVGYLGLIRSQDLIFGIIPIFIFIYLSIKSQLTFKNNILKIIRCFILYISGIICSFGLQLVVWKYLYGSFTNPYLKHGETFNFLKPKIFSVLFSFNHGLLIYSPIIILSILGLILLIKENKKISFDKIIAISGIFLFLLQLYVVASWHSWWGGEAYGGRMFISVYPWLIFGFIYFVKWFLKRFNKLKFIVISVFFIIFNMFSILWYLLSI